jgi:hypothetical protein
MTRFGANLWPQAILDSINGGVCVTDICRRVACWHPSAK